MKSIWINIAAAVIACVVLACDDNDVNAEREKNGINSLYGEWLLYERGYSPGAGYIIDPVSVIPPQIINFKGNGELECSVNKLNDYKFFVVDGDVVGLFKTDPGPAPDSDSFTHSYNVSFDDDGNLILRFRYCFEGCHLGFKKVD